MDAEAMVKLARRYSKILFIELMVHVEGWDGVGRYVQGSDAIYLVFNFLLIFCNINFTCYKQLAPVTKDIPISVLRASILGPILFLCYINDLPGSTLLYSVHTSFC